MNPYRATVQKWAFAITGAAPLAPVEPIPAHAASAAPPPRGMLEVANALMAERGGFGGCERLGVRALVADYADKWVICDQTGKRRLVAIMASPIFPDAVAEATARAIAVRDRLGGAEAAAVVVPLASGRCHGLSFAITPYLHAIALRGAEARWDRWRLRAELLSWLREVTRRTVQAPPADIVRTEFTAPLQRLADNEAMPPAVRGHARDALADLATGHWRPVQVVAHNDLWSGNLLLGPTDGSGPGFGVIDWGASRCEGHAAYDLVRVAMSLDLSPARFAGELAAHATLLGCAVMQMRHHLVAALAWLGDHLGEWPEERYVQTVTRCIDYLDGGLR